MNDDTRDGFQTGDSNAGNSQIIFTGRLHRVHKRKRVYFSNEPPDEPKQPAQAIRSPPPRPARIAQVLALAYKLEKMIESGEVRDRAELARRFGLTRARVTPIMDLMLLAPDVQEEILFMEAGDGNEPISSRGLRDVVRAESWEEQRGKWWEITGGQRGHG